MNVDMGFHIHKELMYRRLSETDSLDDVIQRLLDEAAPVKPSAPLPSGSPKGRSWMDSGVMCEHGTELLGKDKKIEVRAAFVDGRIIVEGETCDSLSEAARVAVGKIRGVNPDTLAINGWTFWKVKRPSDKEFIPIDTRAKGVPQQRTPKKPKKSTTTKGRNS